MAGTPLWPPGPLWCDEEATGAGEGTGPLYVFSVGAAGTISKPFSPKDLPEQLREIWKGLP